MEPNHQSNPQSNKKPGNRVRFANVIKGEWLAYVCITLLGIGGTLYVLLTDDLDGSDKPMFAAFFLSMLALLYIGTYVYVKKTNKRLNGK